MTDPTENATATYIPVAPFVASGGTVADSVSVRISLKIIERFSEGLYSSPNKAFEELVSNAYDAGADSVWVYLPPDLTANDVAIVVIDNGESMDQQGLHDLWLIGESRKRAGVPDGRKPIGKFGIGKLATYVLANRLTYLTHAAGSYQAITMDYTRVRGGVADPHELSLAVLTLTRDEARASLERALGAAGRPDAAVVDSLFASGADHTWTAVVLDDLKEPATRIAIGRLRWILGTAIPLSPAFQLSLNDEELESSKASGTTLWSFTMGLSEGDLPSTIPGQAITVTTENGDVPAYELPDAGPIWGEAHLFESSLQRGRSEELGRSHGIFVRVRNRLINLDDETFSLGPELRHGTLTRFHLVANADGLDEHLASPRESIQESPGLAELKRYLLAIFNRARAVATSADSSDSAPLLTRVGRISDPPRALSQGPLRRVLHRAAEGEVAVQAILGLEGGADIESSQGLVRRDESLLDLVVVEELPTSSRLVRYDPGRRAVVVNSAHPFVANYMDDKGAGEPIRLMGLTELLTAAYMLEEEISADQVQRVMARRDQFLRDLVGVHPKAARVVASALRASATDEKGLEDAVADALILLGYSVKRIGGGADTDGVAVAHLGVRNKDTSESYAITYDAKSSGKSAAAAMGVPESAPAATPAANAPATSPARIRASTAQTSILRVHRDRAADRHRLPFAPIATLLVAPGFQGDGIDDALLPAVCEHDSITPITVEDFARLVELFPVRAVSPKSLRALFDLHAPEDVRSWIDALRDSSPDAIAPVGDVVQVLLEYSARVSAVTVEALSAALYERSRGTRDIPPDQLRTLVSGLQALAPKSLFFDGTYAALNASPDALLAELHASLASYPAKFRLPFGEPPSDVDGRT